MRGLRQFQSLAVLIALPSAAMAQIAPGQSGISTEHTYEGRGALDDLASFGQCFASNQTKDAIRLVSTPPGSVDEAKVYKALFSKERSMAICSWRGRRGLLRASRSGSA